jgi:hypothetical protein
VYEYILIQEGFENLGRKLQMGLSSSWKNQYKYARGFVLIEAISISAISFVLNNIIKDAASIRAKKN